MKIWNDDEVKALFEQVEKCKTEQTALQEAFILHAKAYGRKPNSVRNYYYKEVDNLSGDESRRKRLGLDLSAHGKTHFVSFEKVQEEELFEKIEELVSQGQSVRSACLTLSGGDLSKMTRYQNKYQNMKRKIEEHAKIIPFKNKQTLTDADINSLFLGLVRLIKKSAQEQVGNESNQLLKKALADLTKRTTELELLRGEFEMMKKQNQDLLLRLEKIKKDSLAVRITKNRTPIERETKRV